MKIDLKWLKRHVDIPVPAAELVEIFPKLGMEVEASPIGGLDFPPSLVVGEILSIAAHPKADRLRVCQVQVDGGKSRTIVCGAKNFKPGDRVPVALPGSLLPDGLRIEARELRGIRSEGMMCSARELGLSDEHEGLLILSENPTIGTAIRELFPLEEADFEIETTANRGELLSHLGVARELAAFFRKPLREEAFPIPLAPYPVAPAGGLSKEVLLQSAEVPYYCLFEIHDLRVGESPDWLQRDLKAIGLRPINNVVDLSNWILFDCGQPLHAFDADALRGDSLQVRPARQGERIRTLDGQERPLEEGILVIADEKSPLSIAGVMGGASSAIRPDTRHIFLESAYFHPASVRRSSQALDLRSDSSHRFERDIDPGRTLVAGQWAVRLILQVCGGTLKGCRVLGQPSRERRVIELTPSWVAERCGCPLAPEDVAENLTALGYGVDQAQLPWKVEVPSCRADVHRPIDLVEEFLRIYGNERIPLSPPSAPVHHRGDAAAALYFREVADYLRHRGAVEAIHSSFRSEAETGFWEKNLQALRSENPSEIEAGFGEQDSRAFQIENRSEAEASLGEKDFSTGCHGPSAPSAEPRGQTAAFRRNAALCEAKGAMAAVLPGAVKILRIENPSVENQSHLRPSLIPGLLDTLTHNRQSGQEIPRLFENGHVFIPYGGKLWEVYATAYVQVLGFQRRHWEKLPAPGLMGLKATALALAAIAQISEEILLEKGAEPGGLWSEENSWHCGDFLGKNYRLRLGILDPSGGPWELPYPIAAVEICLLPRYFEEKSRVEPRFRPFSLYPRASRDLALLLERSVPAETVRRDVLRLAKRAAGRHFEVEEVEIFDLHEGENLPPGKKSLALAIDFHSEQRTLRESEVQHAFELLQRFILRETPYEIRCDKEHNAVLQLEGSPL
ncbi:MAG: phenylalanine--tRNA ligase subunit beta [Puniceicoccales bacterium]|jgi:phenylalanyl-tRNA synthetase beta chain|nr:phenylalanine--tRNA ligase subunit beta [Puniceicoccales bacterium]